MVRTDGEEDGAKVEDDVGFGVFSTAGVSLGDIELSWEQRNVQRADTGVAD